LTGHVLIILRKNAFWKGMRNMRTWDW